MGLLAAAEHDRHLYLVVLLQETQNVTLLGLVIVGSDLRPQLHLANGHLLLMLTRLLALLLLLVLVLRVIQHPAYRRLRLGSDLDEVEVTLTRIGERLVALHDTYLLTVVADQANLGNAN